MNSLNLFATVLTYAAPSSNYRGDNDDTRTVLQKIKKDGKDHTIISPESMRNALREMLAKVDPRFCNRSRLFDQKELAVRFEEFPNPEKYADDFFFGYLVTNKKKKEENKGKLMKRDSVLRMNMALALTPYRFNTVFFQSPKNDLTESADSAILHREVVHTAYQYPFAIAGNDCLKGKAKWTFALLKSIGELSDVAGGHARSYFEMSPKSIVARLSPQLVAGYDTYGFDQSGTFDELSRINRNDLPGAEFWIGGEIVRSMTTDDRKHYEDEGTHLYENPQRLIAKLTEAFLAQGAK
ncbi:MAG: CRISPR-associated autoregulator, Cst2 family [Acidobacteria bacterium]|nr:CRISPR-associated autoregulator, Cst2 family [Acidobacteriota bacterium]